MMPGIATIGSHTALQILKGAKDEGLKTLVIHTPQQSSLYRRYGFIDEYVEIPTYRDILRYQQILLKKNYVLIPHGSIVAHLGIEGNEALSVPYYGNKAVLAWESDRDRQRKWLEGAGITMPRQFKLQQPIDFPVIVKSFGAAGGRGYFIARNNITLKQRIARFGNNPYTIQEYVVGVPLYIHYFYSLMQKRLEILGMDRRYETNADGIGRIPARDQIGNLEPSFVVVGNSPLVLRESMLEEAYTMGEDVLAESREVIDKRGLWGPFCLETIITPDQKFYCIEISCRIVAGTNICMDNSPYASLFFNEQMSMGRRIAREIKEAFQKGMLKKLLN